MAKRKPAQTTPDHADLPIMFIDQIAEVRDARAKQDELRRQKNQIDRQITELVARIGEIEYSDVDPEVGAMLAGRGGPATATIQRAETERAELDQLKRRQANLAKAMQVQHSHLTKVRAEGRALVERNLTAGYRAIVERLDRAMADLIQASADELAFRRRYADAQDVGIEPAAIPVVSNLSGERLRQIHTSWRERMIQCGYLQQER